MQGNGWPSEQEADRISTRLAELAGVMNVVVAEMVDLVAQADACEAWGGYRSIGQWLMLATGTSSRRASKWVRIARQLEERPVLSAAFAGGELSEDQVAAVARVPVHNEAEITDLARFASVPQLQRIMSSYSWPEPTDPGAPREDDELRRRMTFGYDDQGWWRINGYLPGFEGAVIEKALHLSRDRLHGERESAVRAAKAAGTDPLLTPEVPWADAAVAMADADVAAQGKGRSNRDRYLTFLHVETAPDGHLHARLHRGPALPDALRRYLTCDGQVRPLMEVGGVPVNVGRTQRVVPDRLRWVIEDRDRGCRVPGCAIRHVEAHHIDHWENGGSTDAANLVALCPAHHRLHHQGSLPISGNPNRLDGLEFRLANGRRLEPRPPVPPGGLDHAIDRLGLPAPNWEHPSGEPCASALIWFSPPVDHAA